MLSVQIQEGVSAPACGAMGLVSAGRLLLNVAAFPIRGAAPLVLTIDWDAGRTVAKPEAERAGSEDSSRSERHAQGCSDSLK